VPDSWPGWDADQAVAALYHAHYRSLARIAALLVGDGAMAEEIVQDAFVSVHRAWRHLQDGDGALDHLRRAVVSAARSQGAASHDPPCRPRGRAGTGLPAPGTPAVLLMAALHSLAARQREALVLKYYAGWPDAQIAAAMGISRHALNDCIRRGMSALQSCAAPTWSGDANLPADSGGGPR
jgi:DNA-directed RNA polymerase specialized sigma24 family protein